MSQAIQGNTTTIGDRPSKPASSVNAPSTPPVEVMAALLRTMGTDLGEERGVIRVLIGAKFSSDQVLNLMDEAIAFAR